MLGNAVERADAARNRGRILAAARKLFARDGVAATSMDAIALEAGVGKGTLFRRFGDRASLALALLESAETEFQESFIRGPAPLGPGAAPAVRLIAFGRALLSHIAVHGDLMLAAQTGGVPGRRLDAGPHGAYRAHVIVLIRDGAPDLDAEYTAEALLAQLGAEVVLHQLRGRGMPLSRLADGWEALARRMLAAPSFPDRAGGSGSEPNARPTTDPAALIRTLFAAMDSGDQDIADALIAEDVRFRFANQPVVIGKRAFIAGRGALRDSIRGFAHEIVWLGRIADAVIVQLNVTYTRLDGSTVTIPCCDAFRVRDGVITEYRIYIDIGPALRSD